MSKKNRKIFLSRKELRKLFRKATGFCMWDEYERGYDLRDSAASSGVNYYLNEFEKTRKASGKKDKLHEIDIDHLIKTVRSVIDLSYSLYYNFNGTFREDKFSADEKNGIADRVYREFVELMAEVKKIQ